MPENFVFFIRALDPERRFVVLRKVLYVDDVRPGAASEELLHTEEQVSNAMREFGVRLAVVSQNMPLRFESQRMLRKTLQGDDFTLLQQFPVTSNQPRWRGENLLLYERKNWTPPTGGVLRIRMLTLPHDIEIPMSQLKGGMH